MLELQSLQFCGSPEMHLKQGNSQTVDFYCLSVFLYELLADHHLAIQQTQIKYIKIFLSYKLIQFIKEFESLLIQSLDKNVRQSLGDSEGIQEIFQHSFFAQIDFKLQIPKRRIRFQENDCFRQRCKFTSYFGSSFYYESSQVTWIKSVYKEWIAHINLQTNTLCMTSYHSQGRQLLVFQYFKINQITGQCPFRLIRQEQCQILLNFKLNIIIIKSRLLQSSLKQQIRREGTFQKV
ncbi:unnamed protein product [Paramecium octaurelia]|uniref:Protein kinase domain-containing protein n=1 Tax=Paramecium octaurelia TaxID=43137 RepID=A0A8S1YM90_PAROT|nr:unnamed protein product [Paramecium octaurelia]